MTAQPQVTNQGTTFTDSSPLEGIRQKTPRWLIISGSLAIAGTSSAGPHRAWSDLYVPQLDATAASDRLLVRQCAPAQAETPEAAIATLRRLSGLTWDQLGELFEVSRRSVHFWASGKPLNAANEARLMRALAVIQYADRGDPELTRRALFEPVGGLVPFDLLARQGFEEARDLLGEGARSSAVAMTDLSPVAKRARQPLRPEELADARHDQAHRDLEGSRPARTIRNARRTRG